MKEQGQDGAVVGFRIPTDGWHAVEFQEGIDTLKQKDNHDVEYQNERGFKTYKFPAKVIAGDTNDPDDGADASQLVGVEKGGQFLANILAAVGLWDAICKAFPGDDVSVFDAKVIDGIKTRMPGKACMIKFEVGKDPKTGNPRANVRQIASFAKYKEILKEESAKGKGKAAGGGKSDPGTAKPKAEEDAPW